MSILWLMAGILIVGGCLGQVPSPPDTERQTVRIGYVSTESFDQRFANLANREFPNVRIDIVPMKDMIRGKQSVNEWFASNQVDLIYMPPASFKDAIDSNVLLELDLYMTRDAFPEDELIPGIMKLTRAYGGGNVYGLPTNFYSEAIAYNQERFDRSKVPYLSDGMTWAEMLSAVRRVDGGFSVHLASPFHLLIRMGQSEQLQMVSPDRQVVAMDSPAWQSLWAAATEADRSGSIHYDDINRNPFLAGERAAALVSYDEYKALEQADPSFQWSLVTAPAAIALEGGSTAIRTDGFWAIPSGSVNPDKAWEFIRFFMSDSVAKWGYRSQYGFSTLVQAFSMDSANGDKAAVFYAGEPMPWVPLSWPDELPEMVNRTFADIVDGSESVESGMRQLQERVEGKMSRYP